MEEQKNNTNNEQKKGKGVLIAVIVIILIAIIGVGIVFALKLGKPKSNITISSTDDMQNLINSVYEGQADILPPTLNTQIVDINNADVLKSFTGLTSNENIDAVVASEPMIGAQAYSFVLVKVKDGADADSIAKQMSENIDTRKWICVEAEKLYATSVDNLAVLVMSSDEWATPVYNKLKEVLGAYNEEYVKENNTTEFDQSIEEKVY